MEQIGVDPDTYMKWLTTQLTGEEPLWLQNIILQKRELVKNAVRNKINAVHEKMSLGIISKQRGYDLIEKIDKGFEVLKNEW